jgi:tetratricopeptide (TPR) repeat protein
MSPRPPSSRSRALPACALSALLVWLASACGAGEAAAWVERVRVQSQGADLALASGAALEAEAALAAILEGAVPRGVAQADRRALLQDAWARRALLRLQQGRPSEAEAAASAGLALGAGGDVFEATLLIARGRAHEALGRDGDAAADYDRAAAIDERLLGALLHETGDQTGGDR